MSGINVAASTALLSLGVSVALPLTAHAITQGVDCSATGDTFHGVYFTEPLTVSCMDRGALGAASIPTGVLRARSPFRGLDIETRGGADLFDAITVAGFTDNATYTIPVTMTVHGSYGATGDGITSDVAILALKGALSSSDGELGIQYGQGYDQFEVFGYNNQIDVVSKDRADVLLTITDFVEVSSAAPVFSIVAQLATQAYSFSFADFSHTASLSLTLPPGLTYTSASGAFLSESAVPEPAVWTLMLVGLGGAGAALRARRHPQPLDAGIV